MQWASTSTDMILELVFVSRMCWGRTTPKCALLIGLAQDKSSSLRSLVPEVALALSAVHSLVIYNPPAWVGLPARLAVDQLLDLDLQVTHLCIYAAMLIRCG
jgi:hypothetical protein